MSSKLLIEKIRMANYRPERNTVMMLIVSDGATVVTSSTELPAVLAFFSCMGI